MAILHLHRLLQEQGSMCSIYPSLHMMVRGAAKNTLRLLSWDHACGCISYHLDVSLIAHKWCGPSDEKYSRSKRPELTAEIRYQVPRSRDFITKTNKRNPREQEEIAMSIFISSTQKYHITTSQHYRKLFHICVPFIHR